MNGKKIIANEISVWQRIVKHILTLSGKNETEIPETIRSIIKYELKIKGGM